MNKLKLAFALPMALLLTVIFFYIPTLGLELFGVTLSASGYAWWGVLTYIIMIPCGWTILTRFEQYSE